MNIARPRSPSDLALLEKRIERNEEAGEAKDDELDRQADRDRVVIVTTGQETRWVVSQTGVVVSRLNHTSSPPAAMSLLELRARSYTQPVAG